MTMKKSMRTIVWICIISFAAHSGQAQGLESAATDPDQALEEARQLAYEKKYDDARVLLGAVLVNYPEYADVRNLLAKTYSWDGHYETARGYFDQLLAKENSNREVWLAAVNNEIFAKHTDLALRKVNSALEFLPADPDLLALKQKIEASSIPDPDPPEVRSGYELQSGEFSNNMGVFSSVQVFDQVFDSQYSLGMEYIRQEKFGQLIPRITFTNRFGQDGIQYELDAYPKIGKRSYAYVNYGYSGALIFPKHRAGAEYFTMISKTMELSAGVRHLDFRESTATTWTGSIGLYTGNYYMALRPLITPRSNNPTAYFGSVLLRKYGKTADFYLGARINAGVEPESQQVFLGNTLLSESTRYVEIQELLMEYQFSSQGLASLYRTSLGVRRQEFLAEPGSYFWAFTAGIRYLSRF